MPLQLLTDSDKIQYNKLVNHPLQSWEWGEFRKKTEVEIERYGVFKSDKLISAFQISFHKIPYTPFTIGYIPKSFLPDQTILQDLTQIGQKHNCIFIQLEPNIITNPQLTTHNSQLTPSSHPIFTKYTFQIDLNKSEDELLKNMHPKTRYNIRIAQKHGVVIQEENTDEAFNQYLRLTSETTKRQSFYSHNEKYHKLMWQFLHLQPATCNLQPIAHLFTARYQGKILVTWILFLFNNVLYYPYGASSTEHKNVMASTLMMWETMKWGKKMGAKTFDLWGTPGPDPLPSDPYYGFHKFKLGFGPKLVEFVGSFDLVLKQPHYILFTIANKIRWLYLKLKSK